MSERERTNEETNAAFFGNDEKTKRTMERAAAMAKALSVIAAGIETGATVSVRVTVYDNSEHHERHFVIPARFA